MASQTTIIGQSVPRLESRDKVTGRAEFIHTMQLPGMLHAKVFRSDVPHGRITSIDTAEAAAVPGVFGVYTGEDIKKVIPEPYYGPAFHDQPILALDKVRHVGEPVAVVLAEDPHVAEEAAQLIYAEYVELPAVYDEIKALDSEAIVHEELKPAGTFPDLKHLAGRRDTNIALDYHLRRGDTEAAEALLISALEKNPQASASRVNLADLYRAQGKEEAARATLKSGIALNKEDPSLWFSLALLEVREGNGEAALGALEKAASLEETPSYYHYVYAVAQHDQGRPAEAMATLKVANRAAPGQPNVIAALMQYSQLVGDMKAAQRYQAELRNTAQAAGVQ